MTCVDVAIISNGPGADKFPGSAGFNAVIGVNWAWIELGFNVDWWAFVDFRTYQMFTPWGNPAICTKRAQVQKIQDRLVGSRHEYVTKLLADNRLFCTDELEPPKLPAGLIEWDSKSGPLALVLARHLGATRMKVYGAGMAGTTDHAGRVGTGRTDKRWGRERRLWEALEASFKSEGITVERVGHADG